MAGPIDINSLTDEEAQRLMGRATPAALPASGAIKISDLTDEQIAQLTAQPMSGPESFARLLYKHLTFGTEPGADKSKSHQAAEERPGLNIISAIPATVAQTMALGPLAAAGKAAQGAGLLAQTARGLGTAAEFALLPNMKATTALGAMRTGAKLGGNYSALEAAGSGLTNPDESLGQVVGDVAKSYGLGTVGGAAFGVGAHGVSRAVGAFANRTLPNLREAMEAARSPEGRGIRDIIRHAGYDDADIAKLRALLQQADNDPALAARFQDLNLIEALKAGRLVPMKTGELKPEVVTTRNLDQLAQQAANIEGAGQNRAFASFAARKNEMSSKIQGDIDQTFGRDQTLGHTLADQFGISRNIPSKAADAERLPGLIDQHFGSGNRAAEADVVAAQKRALSQRYERMRKKPLELVDPELTRVAQLVPEFQQALNYAAKNDMIRLAQSGAEWKKPWSAQEIGQGLQTLSPSNMLDIHHALLLNAKPPITGATPETLMAGKLKDWFSKWVDKRLGGHKALREEYASFKQMMEAQEHATNLPVASGGVNHPALSYLEKISGDLQAAARDTQAKTAAYDAAMARFQGGQIKSTRPTELNKAIAAHQAKAEVVNSFRKAWGESLKQQLASGKDHSKFVRDALTNEGQRRILMVLGERDGRSFVQHLTTIEARNQGMSLGLNAGGSDHTALQFFNRAVQSGDAESVAAFRQAWGDRIKQELAATNEAGVNAILNKLTTQQGKSRILHILGKEDGTVFIESLYNKQLQGRLGNTLYGNSHTPWVQQRQATSDALWRVASGLMHLRPSEVWKGGGDLLSAAYRQRNADRLNELFSRQGPEEVKNVLDAALATQALRTTGHPFVRNPLLRASPRLAVEPSHEKPKTPGPLLPANTKRP